MRCASASCRRRSRSSRSVRRGSVTSQANTIPPVVAPSAPRTGTTSAAHTRPGLAIRRVEALPLAGSAAR
jgi:hypothetical protein